MVQPKPWLEEVVEAMRDIGGHGSLADIYERVEERGYMHFDENLNWRAQIRKVIETHSSDSDTYTGVFGGEFDLFYAVEGKGKGRWGLRNFVTTEKTVDLTEDFAAFPEGRKMLRQHIVRERNPRVIQRAKEAFVVAHGYLFCEICHFNFAATFGDVGENYIEGHHLIPVSTLKEGDVTRVEDIALVCSNCHRMLHRKRPWLSREHLAELLVENQPMRNSEPATQTVG